MKISNSYDTPQPFGQATATSANAGESFQSVLSKARTNASSAPATESPSTAPKDSSAKAKGPTALQELLDYMKKTPEQRMREAILKKMGLTEESLKTMPPEKRAAVEETIAAKIKELMQEPKEAEKAQAQTGKGAAQLGLATR
ncbi:MAG: hypothetical protein KGZ83_06290 [Sulfuricella sp.]|nr:hypothetical protein [Sulfuricella sp.]